MMELFENKENNRVEWVDIGKGICTFMVIMSHLNFCPVEYRKIFMPFFLTGFFFLSGYVYKKADSFKGLMYKKSKTILLPWAIFSVVDILTRFLFGNENLDFIQYFQLALIQIKGYHETLWFLPCLFISFVPFYFITKYMKNKNIIIFSFTMMVVSYIYGVFMKPNLLPWNTISLPWHLHIIFICNFFMVLGFWYKENEEVINQKVKMNNLVQKSFIITIIYVIISNTLGEYGLTTYNKNIIAWIFIILFGVFVIILISRKINSNKLISFIGRNSLLYFCMHIVIAKIINKLFIKLDFITMLNKNILVCQIITIMCTIFIIMILIIPIKFINKYLKFVIGKF